MLYPENQEPEMHVVIGDHAYKGYNGYIGMYLFKDGVSVEKIPLRLAMHYGNNMDAHDLNGVSLNTVSLQENARKGIQYVAPSSETEVGEKSSQNDAMAQIEPLVKEVSQPKPLKEAKKPQKPLYTLEELEAIADNEGIKGLRAIGEKFGVKGRGIEELISEIMEAQGE